MYEVRAFQKRCYGHMERKACLKGWDFFGRRPRMSSRTWSWREDTQEEEKKKEIMRNLILVN